MQSGMHTNWQEESKLVVLTTMFTETSLDKDIQSIKIIVARTTVVRATIISYFRGNKKISVGKGE